MKYLESVLIATVLVILGSNSFASGFGPGKADNHDWPRFRGPAGNAISEETGLLQKWPDTGIPEVWRAPIGMGYSGIAISGDRLFTMASEEESEFLLCLDAATGQEKWRREIAPVYKDATGNGPRSTPTVDENLVYAISGDGHLAALKTTTGEQVWNLNLKEKFQFKAPDYWWGFSGSPFIADNLLLINAGGEGSQSIAALDKKSGQVLWTTHSDLAAYSTPIAINFAGKEQLVFVTASHVVSVSPTGDVLWKYPWGGSIIKIAMPVFIPPDKIFVSASYDIGAVLLKMQGQENEISVKELWNSKVMRNHFHSSIMVGKHLYGFDNATLKCIEVETGEQEWAKRRLGKGSLIYADGHFIVLSERGLLVLVEATPERYKEKGRFEVMDGRTWTPPSLANGKLYLRNQKELVCLNLKKDE